MEEFITLLFARLTELGVFNEQQAVLVKEIQIGSAAAAIQRLVGTLSDAQWQMVSTEIGQCMRESILAMDATALAVFDSVLAARAPVTHPPCMVDPLDRARASTSPSLAIANFLRSLNEVRRERMIARMTRPEADLYRAFEEQQSLGSLMAFVDKLESLERLIALASALEPEEQALLLGAVEECIGARATEPAPVTLPGTGA